MVSKNSRRKISLRKFLLETKIAEALRYRTLPSRIVTSLSRWIYLALLFMLFNSVFSSLIAHPLFSGLTM